MHIKDKSFEIAFRWMSQTITDDSSTSVQVMAWCHQAPSHYLSRCWPRAVLPYGVNSPQWVNPCNASSTYIWLTLYMLNCFDKIKICTSIIYHFSTVQVVKILSHELFILHSQCPGCCWPGDIRIQGISTLGIDMVLTEYFGLSNRKVNTCSQVLLFYMY